MSSLPVSFFTPVTSWNLLPFCSAPKGEGELRNSESFSYRHFSESDDGRRPACPAEDEVHLVSPPAIREAVQVGCAGGGDCPTNAPPRAPAPRAPPTRGSRAESRRLSVEISSFHLSSDTSF